MNNIFRRLLRPTDPRLYIRITPEVKQALTQAAKRNARPVAQEAYVRLAVSLEHEEVMLSDRLLRLIYCRKLAYQEK